MKQFTEEFAKEYLKKHKKHYAIRQFKDFSVVVCDLSDGFHKEINLGKMSEHPQGWKKSLTTRADL